MSLFPDRTTEGEERVQVIGVSFVTPACLARPAMKIEHPRGFDRCAGLGNKAESEHRAGMGVQKHEARVASIADRCQSGRLQHAELGKSAPATRAGRQGCGPASGSKSCPGSGGEASRGLLDDAYPQSVFQRKTWCFLSEGWRNKVQVRGRGRPQQRQNLFRSLAPLPHLKRSPPHYPPPTLPSGTASGAAVT